MDRRIMWWFLIFFITALGSAPARANNLGLAAYGLFSPSWKCAPFLNAFQKSSTIKFAFLYNTFGTDRRCYDQVMDDPRPKSVEIILINESCQRSNTCGDYEFLSGITEKEYARMLAARDPGLLSRMAQYFAGARSLVRTRNATCYVSPGLESNLTDPAAISVLLEQTRQAFPECRVVWNPVGMGAERADSDVMEGHTEASPYRDPVCIANLDGQDLHSVNLPAYYAAFRRCKLNFLWTYGMNGISRPSVRIDARFRTQFSLGARTSLLAKLLSPHPFGQRSTPH